MIQATGDASATYTIDNISNEYVMVIQPELAHMIDKKYADRLAVLYDCVLRHRKNNTDKSDTLWNINLNVPAGKNESALWVYDVDFGVRPDPGALPISRAPRWCTFSQCVGKCLGGCHDPENKNSTDRYLYVIEDAQLNIFDDRYVSALCQPSPAQDLHSAIICD